MRKIICVCFVVGCFAACADDKDVCSLDEVQIEHLELQVNEMDSVLSVPQGINVFKDKLLILEPKKSASMLTVLSRDGFKYLFSGIDKGHARHEVLSMRRDYFASTDTSFFVLGRNEEKEYVLRDRVIEYVGSTVITIPDALNGVLHLGGGKYITAGLTNGTGNEHLLYVDGKYEGFGEYPGPDLKDGGNFFYNGSQTAGMAGKDKVWGFYKSHPLVRCYDLEGNLLREIEIVDSHRKQVSATDDRDLCYYKIKWNSRYIAVLYNAAYTWNEFYDLNKDGRERELQLWTWDGQLERRISFDKPYDIYAVSDDNMFYAMNVDVPNVIYTYDLNE